MHPPLGRPESTSNKKRFSLGSLSPKLVVPSRASLARHRPRNPAIQGRGDGGPGGQRGGGCKPPPLGPQEIRKRKTRGSQMTVVPKSKKSRLSNLDWPRWAVHIAGILPALWIAALGLAGELTVNPYQAVEQRTGRIAPIFLLLGLARPPANL